MNLSSRQLTVIILGIGVTGSLAALLPTPLHVPVTWLGLAAVYLGTAILHGGPQLYGSGRAVSLLYSVAVAVLVTLVPVVLGAWHVQTVRPELAITDMGFILHGSQVVLPFIVAFMAPLGLARTRNWQVVVLAVILAPVVGLTVMGLTSGWGFGPGFVVLDYAFLILIGGITGLPLYLYGRTLYAIPRHKPREITRHNSRQESYSNARSIIMQSRSIGSFCYLNAKQGVAGY